MPSESALDRVKASLAKAHACQESINAFTFIDDEGALARAAGLDATAHRGPLFGVPIGLKDLIDQADHTTTSGSAFFRKHAATDADCVRRLNEAGAVIVGRTGLHEFAFGFSSENPHWGVVRNPWDPTTSVGGSSGGSGAAVAAGIVPIAIGTDTGGSVRVPAALCGTYGLKVTHGKVSLDGVFPLVASIDTVGPLADSMKSLELAYRAMSGDEETAILTDTLRFGIPQPWYEDGPVDADIGQEFQSAMETLRSLGHEVHPLEMPDVSPSIHLWNAIAREVRDVHGAFLAAGEPYGDDVAKRVRDAERVSGEERSAAHEWQRMIRTRFADAFSTVDFVVTPTVPVRKKTIGEDLINGRHYRSVLSYFSAVVNHALHPALAAPLADSGHPPASLQVIGPMNSEPGLIALGNILDMAGVTRFIPRPFETN